MSRRETAARRRVIIVGAGEVAAKYWVPAAALLDWPVAVSDLDLERAKALARRFAPRVHAAAQLRDARPTDDDVIVIATPPGSHARATEQAAEAGARRIIIEKPPFVSAEEMDSTLAVLRRHGAVSRAPFIRRGWPAISAARGLFPQWRTAFGSLQRVRITEGRPLGWVTQATADHGAAGLSGMLRDELPHAFDALFHITGWEHTRPGAATRERMDPLGVSAEISVETEDGPVDVAILGSRAAKLSNTLALAFEGATVTVDMQPHGGLLLCRAQGNRTLLRCGTGPTGVESMFADQLTQTASLPLGDPRQQIETWRGPLSLILRLEEGG